jgi:hypothetical protein
MKQLLVGALLVAATNGMADVGYTRCEILNSGLRAYFINVMKGTGDGVAAKNVVISAPGQLTHGLEVVTRELSSADRRELIESFRKQQESNDAPKCGSRYFWISGHEASAWKQPVDWELFNERYPGRHILLEISGPAVTSDGRLAVVRLVRSTANAATVSEYHILLWRDEDAWRFAGVSGTLLREANEG